MGLTAVAIKAAKGREKQYKLTDSDGLHLLVMPSGQRYWRMNYRHLGRYKTLAFGVWPEVDLADARAKRDEARRVLAKGIDPAEKLKLDRIAVSVAAANTFQAVADEWLAKIEREDLSPVTLKKNRWLLSFTYPPSANAPLPIFHHTNCWPSFAQSKLRGRHESAKRIRATCSQVFRYAIATARADRDIAADLKGALNVPKVTHRAAITTPLEAGALLRAIQGFEGHSVTLSALKLLPHVFVRPGELRFAEWDDFDLEKAVWTIPRAQNQNAPRPFRAAVPPSLGHHRRDRNR